MLRIFKMISLLHIFLLCIVRCEIILLIVDGGGAAAEGEEQGMLLVLYANRFNLGKPQRNKITDCHFALRHLYFSSWCRICGSEACEKGT